MACLGKWRKQVKNKNINKFVSNYEKGGRVESEGSTGDDRMLWRFS